MKKTRIITEYEQGMRDAALVVSSVVAQTAAEIRPGITTNQLDIFAAKLIDKMGAKSYNLNYKPDWSDTAYPAVLCTSVNNEVAHGIPDEYVLKEGDIVGLDLGLTFHGYAGDCGITLPVGKISPEHERLLRFSNRAVYIGAEEVKAGALYSNIGKAVEKYAKQNGYVTNQLFSGHGIGKEMHEEPTIPFFYTSDPDFLMRYGTRRMKAGEVICLEPMLSRTSRGGVKQDDGWTVITQDGSFSSMFEHMILVLEDGYEILTDHFVKHDRNQLN